MRFILTAIVAVALAVALVALLFAVTGAVMLILDDVFGEKELEDEE